MKRLSALIPAAGQGMRLGMGPKAWLELDGRPVLVWLAQKLERIADEVVVAVAAADMAQAHAMRQRYGLSIRLIEGGATRQASITLLVEASGGQYVLIQDAARPFVSLKLAQAVTHAALLHGAAAALLPLEVPVARLSDGWAVAHAPAQNMALFHGPQAFLRAPLLEVVQDARSSGHQQQSIGQLWLDAGRSLHAVVGEKTDIKLTTPEDWLLAQTYKEFLHP